MEVQNCPIAGLRVLKPSLFKDSRGFFSERFNARRFAEAGLPSEFVQDNHSRSLPGVLRGLHYQHTPPQGKLVGVTSGRIWDVALDIRPSSPTFGRHHAVELSAENSLMFWIPAGFAHGFCVLGDQPADVIYKVDNYYNPAGENGIRFDDEDVNIPWPIKNPILSGRDRGLLSCQDYRRNPPSWKIS